MSSATTPSRPASESERLRGKIGLVLPILVEAGQRLVEHPRAPEMYPEYLFVSHCIIRASVPLMATARERATELADDDPVAAGAAVYYEQHIDEELNHDEWLLDDLDAIGGDRSAFLLRPPSPVVAAVAGAQYYWIHHYHPVALLGYIAVLEGYPPSNALIAALRRSTGYAADAFRTLVAHSELDLHHRDEFDEMLDELPLTAEHASIVGISALSTVELLARALDGVAATA